MLGLGRLYQGLTVFRGFVLGFIEFTKRLGFRSLACPNPSTISPRRVLGSGSRAQCLNCRRVSDVETKEMMRPVDLYTSPW